MTADFLKYASGNGASTTSTGAITGSDTTVTLTSDTNFAAKSGEGMVILDEGQVTEELAYANQNSPSTFWSTVSGVRLLGLTGVGT